MKKLSFIRRNNDRHWVGDGFPVRNIFSYNDLGKEISPFLLLDYAGPENFPPSEQRRGSAPTRTAASRRSRSNESYEQWSQAALACSDQRNGSPERQTLCKITESFLASATRALPLPDRLAIARAQSFKREALLTRDRITTAASYNRVRASVSPHLDILPLRSTSPD